MSGSVDRKLLYGIIALEIGEIDHNQFAQAVRVFTQDKGRSIGEILVEQSAISEQTLKKLAPLVDARVAFHDGDERQSIESFSMTKETGKLIEGIDDDEVRNSFQPALQRMQNADVASDDDVTYPPSRDGTAADGKERFQIRRPHKKGGLGEVFVAHDRDLNRDVALKEIQTAYALNKESQLQFLLEAEITGGLEHPGIVPVYAKGERNDGRPYYAMRFIRGKSLHQAIKLHHQKHATLASKSLDFRDLLKRFVDVCEAIEYAHDRQVLHRDLKPGNIMLGPYGESLVVDWGMALALSETQDQDGTNQTSSQKVNDSESEDSSREPPLRLSGSRSSSNVPGRPIGTIGYMSPEQADGRVDEMTPATDVYSMGATLYHLLTGKSSQPLDVDDGEVLQRIIDGEFDPPSKLKSEVPQPLESICLKAMQTHPRNRYGSVKEIAKDIERWLADEPVSVYAESFLTRTGRWVRRHQTIAAVATVSTLLLTVGLSVWGTEQAKFARTEHARKAAVAEKEKAVKETQIAVKRTAESEKQAELAIKETMVANQRKKEADVATKKAIEERRKAELSVQEKDLLLQRERAALEKSVKLEQVAEETATRTTYNAQLVRAASFLENDPLLAQRLLKDESTFPADKRSFVWNLRHRQSTHASRSFSLHSSWVSALAFGGDNSLWTVGRDGAIFRVANDNANSATKVHSDDQWLYRMAIDIDSQTIAFSGVRDGAIHVIRNGTYEGTLNDPGEFQHGVLSALAFSKDGGRLVSAGERYAKVWDMASKEVIRTRVYGTQQNLPGFLAAGFINDSTVILGGSNCQLETWNFVTDQASPFGPSEVLDFSVSSDANRCAVVGKNGCILIAGPSVLWTVPKESSRVSFVMNDAAVVIADSQGTVSLLCARSGAEILSWKAHDKAIDALDVSPDGYSVATGSRDRKTVVFELRDLGVAAIPSFELGGGICFDADEERRWIAVGRDTGAIDLWNAKTLTKVKVIDGGNEAIVSLAFSKDGKWLASGTELGRLRIWQTNQFEKPLDFDAHRGSIAELVFSTDARLLASASADGTVKTWQIESIDENRTPPKSTLVAQHPDGATSVVFHPTGSHLVSSGKDGVISIFDLQSKKTVAMDSTLEDPILSLAFSPNGQLLYSGGQDKTLRIWDFPARKLRRNIGSITHAVGDLSLTSDGKTLVAGGWGGEANLFDALSGESRGVIPCDQSEACRVKFLANNRLLCMGASRTLWLWDHEQVQSRWKTKPSKYEDNQKLFANATIQTSPGYQDAIGRPYPTLAPKPDREQTIQNSIGMDFVLIQPGKFSMGSHESPRVVASLFNSTESIYRREHPLHQVEISRPFYMCTKETTVEQFIQFVESDPTFRPNSIFGAFGGLNPVSGNEIAYSNGETLSNILDSAKERAKEPITYVSWEDAVAFCRWLSEKETGATYRLPTEAEWEYACRANTDTRFHFGDDPIELAKFGNIGDYNLPNWFATMRNRKDINGRPLILPGAAVPSDGFNEKAGRPAPVAQYKPNDWGLYDMHGNVWEWCFDGYHERFYEHSPKRDPLAPSSNDGRVLRGSCFI